MKKLLVVLFAVSLFLGFLGWAFQWRSQTLMVHGVPTLIRMNRFTGTTQVFDVYTGWRPVRPGNDPEADAIVNDALKDVLGH